MSCETVAFADIFKQIDERDDNKKRLFSSVIDDVEKNANKIDNIDAAFVIVSETLFDHFDLVAFFDY